MMEIFRELRDFSAVTFSLSFFGLSHESNKFYLVTSRDQKLMLLPRLNLYLRHNLARA